MRDVDGNVFVDLTGGFAVATAGHSNVAVTSAIATQAAELGHGLGDVHPSAVKVALLEKLAEITPQPLQISILGSAGAEAVEAALKTTWLHTKRTDVIAFDGGYHGLSLGALAVTQRHEFREPFRTQLNPHVRFAPFPTNEAQLASALQTLDSMLDHNVAAILVEPIQGRGGIRMPAADFLAELRARCDGQSRVLIFDEIYTGMGRTGRWFACEHWNVVPDLMTIGKGLTGSIALSACIGTAEVMSSWPASAGEAIHTSTFLGNPIACAAGLAQIREIEQRSLLQRAQSIGAQIQQRTQGWADRFPELLEVSGLGALQGIRFSPANPSLAIRICDAALQRGVIALAEGPHGEVLALTPPVVVTDEQLDHSMSVLEELL